MLSRTSGGTAGAVVGTTITVSAASAPSGGGTLRVDRNYVHNSAKAAVS